MMKTICETQDHYPKQVLFQTEDEPNQEEGQVKSWGNRVIHH